MELVGNIESTYGKQILSQAVTKLSHHRDNRKIKISF